MIAKRGEGGLLSVCQGSEHELRLSEPEVRHDITAVGFWENAITVGTRRRLEKQT